MVEEKRNFYRIRPYPGKHDQFDYFNQHNLIALGWSKIGDVHNLDRSQIIDRLQFEYASTYKNKTRASGLTAGYFLKLMSMEAGDVVLIPYDNQIVKLVEVTSPYQFVPELVVQDMAHVVSTKTITQLFSKELATDLLAAVNSRVTLISLNKYKLQILELFNHVPWIINKDDFVHYSGTTAGKSVSLGVTKNVKKKELHDFIDSLDME
ncbi:hypothetical protein [Lactiplantibacillus plantarum]|uniref:hypothetical protein n=1 Tax=Lactiplantibacillus plantarum TaxID=1590 RepID=UPI001BAA7F1D|nr:hypothetical protein [Lactiplantibacillus plantarum]MBS0955443.1 hypothetical protein [Lactiplantibacillus plantarum]